MNETTNISFADLGLAPDVFKVINEVGYETPSPIQAQSIPPLLAGCDLLGQAQTGTGKTAAFALPLLSRIKPKMKAPQMLVLTPTRELALQVAESMQTYARHLKNFHVLPVYGGQNYTQQLRQLARGVQVVVGTPGRVQDHLNRGTLKLDKVISVVIDEADEMLKMGFIEEVEQILDFAPEDRQTALFSATMPNEVLSVARKHLKDPVEIRIKSKTSTVEKISQHFWQVKGLHKLDALTRILEAEEIDGMIIFVRTKVATVELAEKLEARGFSSAALNGDMTQMLREKTVDRLKDGSLDIVVATDVAARGLDVPRISHVVNYDIPHDIEAYIHRIGRTGRAGREGKAILFVAPRERRMLSAIERATKQPIKAMALPSRKDITDRRIGLFKEQIAEAMESQDLEFFEELIDQYQSEYDVGHRKIAATLAYLLQKERPLQPDERFAEEIREERPERQQRDRGQKTDDSDMQTYRIEVGRKHGVEPGNIVGAISNEGKINSRSIGRIRLFDHFSLVDLPKDLSSEILHKLKTVWVCDEQLQISVDSGSAAGKNERTGKRRSFGKGKFSSGNKFQPSSGKKPFGKRSGKKKK
ncbi:ATP-dependent RNA helicase CsdA [Malonomonas rubra DSM 5091]|uniref:ATP-dependent RNA helicase DeaD n=1 Tax=Malonomonas rubra DSM 5091 TaxID=1122189 RepID=A0A1M6KIN8_MALRU|nr:DEAD/DEAH box helicase [Malonomonas rubra]SHJ58807.1 ATP-dependent RNA helicase CsdA [Malonomonas rubra DSM 5091]